MRYLKVLLLPLLIAGYAIGQQPSSPSAVRLPEASPPIPLNEPVKLDGGKVYVFGASVQCVVIASPQTILKVTRPLETKLAIQNGVRMIDGDGAYQVKAEVKAEIKMVSPFEMSAKFFEGDGTVKTKTMTDKFLWCVEAVGSGQAELIIIPVGGAEKDVIRKVFDCSGLPRPPPDPTPVTSVAKHVTFVGSEVTPAAIAVNNSIELRALFKAAGITVHVLRGGDPQVAAKGLQAAVDKAGGLPCVILQDELGHVIDQGPMTSVAQVQELTSKHVRR